MSTNTNTAIYNTIREQGIVPLFYHDDAATCVAIAESLYKGGIRSIEFTNRGPQALANFGQLVKAAVSMPGLQLGVGTIKTADEANRFMDAGAAFLISPVFDNDVYDAAYMDKIPWMPGCMTPTEINTAVKAGCNMIKLFPGNVLQPGFVEAIRPLFPGTEFMVTGGVDITGESIGSWLQAGAVAVGLGSKLITKQVIADKDFSGLETITASLLAIARQVKTAS